MGEMVGNLYQLNFNKQSTIEDLELDMLPHSVKYCRLFIKKFPTGGKIHFRNVRIEFVQELIADLSKENLNSINIASTNGTVFKNGAIATTLKSTIFRGSYDITNSVKDAQIVWTKLNDDDWGKKTGKNLDITAEDVDSRDTFVCTMYDTGDAETAEVVTFNEVTIVDLHDTSMFEGYLDSNYPRMQLRDSDGLYKPSWHSASSEEGGLVVQASLYTIGDGKDLLETEIPTNVKMTWYINTGDGYRQITIGDNQIGIYLDEKSYIGKSKTLRIVRNLLTIENPSLSIRCVIEVSKENGEVETIRLGSEYGLSIQGEDGQAGAGFTVMLTNETHQIITSLNGNPIAGELGLNGRAYTDVMVMDMNKTLTPVFQANVKTSGTYSIQVVSSTNVVAQVSSINPARVYIESIDGTTGSVQIKACISGTCTGGECLCPVKTMSVIKAPMGASWMELSTNSFVQDEDGKFSPEILKLFSYEKSYIGDAKLVNSNFYIHTSKDGIEYSEEPIFTRENSVEATFNIDDFIDEISDVRMLKVRMTTIADEPSDIDIQTIPIISEGIDGISGNLWAPNGEIFKNRLQEGAILTLPLEMNVYAGIRDVSIHCKFQWYRQSGSEWKPIVAADAPNYQIANSLGNVLNVHADAVPSLEVIKCLVTYKNLSFEDTITLIDKTDPYQILIQASTEVFKNSKGQAVLNCIVAQNGEDVDQDSTRMVYRWSKFGVKNYLPTTGEDDFFRHPIGLTYVGAKGDDVITITGDMSKLRVGDLIVLDGQSIKKPFMITTISEQKVQLSDALDTSQSKQAEIYYGNFKSIVVNASEVQESNTFYCDVFML